MVHEGVPEFPSDNNDVVSTNNEIILATDSDSDDDDHIMLQGYEPLPLGPPEDINVGDDEESSDSIVDDASQQLDSETIPSVSQIENDLIREVWSSPVPTEVDIKMDSDKVDEVKQAMVNITLPPSAIPEWANNIPEDEWKQHLINRLNILQKNL